MAAHKKNGKQRNRVPWILVAAILLLGSAVAVWLVALRPLSPDRLLAQSPRPATQILDRNGRLLYEVLDPSMGRYRAVSLDEVPPFLQQATIATEDATFYSNPGVDFAAIVRAAWINLRGGEVLAGGSTITQQVARTLLLSPEERTQRTLARKLKESLLAYRLARQFSKDEILALYLNQTYYGSLAYGVEAAAQTYLGKPVRELDLAECAMLAGLPQSPAVYNPLTNLDAAKERQKVVLGLMLKHGMITDEQAQQAEAETLHFAASPFPIQSPHFVMYVRERLSASLPENVLREGGLKVYTTLDLDYQAAAEAAVQRQLAKLAEQKPGEADHNVHNAAVVVLSPGTGDILAMVGSPDYFDATIDGAVNAAFSLRQPGSAIKPITYATAFARDYSPATMLVDTREAFTTKEGDPYVPMNYDLIYHGPVLLREALASSYNLIAVKVLQHVGIPAMVQTARDLGITTLDDSERWGLALTLGGGEVSLVELTQAYAAFASGGQKVSARSILRVEDAQGRILASWNPPDPVQALSPQTAFLITDVLSDNEARAPAFGENSQLKLSRPAAAKTGTTTDWRDNWTLGYTSNLVAGVWVGNADNSPMQDVSGITGAAPIWHDVMETILRDLPVEEFTPPDGLVRVEVCADSGLLPNPNCPHRRLEWFVAGKEPTQVCDWHRVLSIDAESGQLATENCPPEDVVQRIFTFWPAEALDWAREQNLPLPPTETCVLHPTTANGVPPGPAAFASLVLVAPDPNGVYQLSASLPPSMQALELSARLTEPFTQATVTFFVDGQPVVTVEAPPYRTMWMMQAGDHTVWAEAALATGERLVSDVRHISVLP
jgi:1A family penicillin-binding protein